MSSFIIEGGRKLSGSITPQGAKNEALQVLCATLLTPDTVTISNLPDILDVNNLIGLLADMGVEVHRQGEGVCSFRAAHIDMGYLLTDDFYRKSAALRGSVMLVGPLVARFGHAMIAKPGGDKIGRRRLDTHFIGIQKLGADFHYDPDRKRYEIEARRLTGTYMLLDEASVTGTANIIMAAVMAEGTTTIYNAACEPYVQQLCRMLNAMGARITGIGSNLLTIEGVRSLHGCTHRILPDMIEVGSFIGMAAMTASELTIKDVAYRELGIIPDSFRRLGIEVVQRGDDIHIPRQEGYTIESFIHQKMFESRLFFVDKLIDMGAKIILCDPHRATVIGMGNNLHLRAANMTSPDIRAGIALLIAALCAEGTSTIHNIDQIDRGYQRIDLRLNALGANIRRVDSPAQ